MPTSSMIPMMDKGQRCVNCGVWVTCPCCGGYGPLNKGEVLGVNGQTFCCKACYNQYYEKRGINPNLILKERNLKKWE
jgi:hypothetical protein